MLQVRADGTGTRRTVVLTGECDLASAPTLQELLGALRPPDVTHLTIDATDLELLDSTGLGVIIGALKRLREAGGDLEIKGATGTVRRILAVTGLDRVIDVG